MVAQEQASGDVLMFGLDGREALQTDSRTRPCRVFAAVPATSCGSYGRESGPRQTVHESTSTATRTRCCSKVTQIGYDPRHRLSPPSMAGFFSVLKDGQWRAGAGAPVRRQTKSIYTDTLSPN